MLKVFICNILIYLFLKCIIYFDITFLCIINYYNIIFFYVLLLLL